MRAAMKTVIKGPKFIQIATNEIGNSSIQTKIATIM
jgi:hypothetical protein